MSVDSAAATNNGTTVNFNFYNNSEQRNGTDGISVGGVDNLPEGTTLKEVLNAVSNGSATALFGLLKEMIDSSNMDNDTKEFALTEVDSLLEDNLTEVNPEVQARTDETFVDEIVDVAKTIMEFFLEVAEGDRAKESRRSGEGESGEVEGGGNWLIQLAKAMAEVQSQFLEKLMDSYGKMRDNVASDPGSKMQLSKKRKRTIQARKNLFRLKPKLRLMAVCSAWPLK